MSLTDSAIESYVIGACLHNKETAQFLLDRLGDINFGTNINRMIWRIIKLLYENQSDVQVDKLTLRSKIQAIGMSGSIPNEYIDEIQVVDIEADRLSGYIQRLLDRTVPRETVTLLEAIKVIIAIT